MYRLPLFLLFLSFTLTTQAQGDRYADSLRAVLHEVDDKATVKEITFLLGEHLLQRAPEEAERYARLLGPMIDLEKDSSDWCRLQYIRAGSNRWHGNYKTALEIYDELYSYYIHRGDRPEIARSGRFIGILNMYLGNDLLAQRHLIECAEIYEEIGTAKERASIQNSLASFYLNLDQLEKAKASYLVSLEQFEALNDSAGIASINGNLGYVNTEIGEYQQAEEHLMLQKKYNAVFPTQREMGFHHDFLGALRQKQGRLDEAYMEHLTALKIREQLSSTYNLCESKLNMGQVLNRLGRYDEAIDQLADVLSFEEHQSHSQTSLALSRLAEAYEAKGDYKQALSYFKQYENLTDSVKQANSIQVIAEKDAAYQKQEQDAEIAILNKENEVAQLRLGRTRLVVYISLMGLLIAGVLFYFIYQQFQKIKRQNKVINTALKDKSLLIHETHHRVKNNLQVISSLLSLQSKYITDPIALNAIKDGRNRVQSMALIHKNLYQENDIRGVDMRSYLSNLIQGIFHSYNLSENEIALDLQIDDLRLDIDTVIPIGLITNELITNALRYAFVERPADALITVRLKQETEFMQLTVKDNGVGIPDENIDKSNDTTFGQRMIKSFVRKLKAELSIDNSNGTKVEVRVPSA